MDGMGWDRVSRETVKSAAGGWRSHAVDARKETKDRRVLCLLGQGNVRRVWFLV